MFETDYLFVGFSVKGFGVGVYPARQACADFNAEVAMCKNMV